MNRERAQLRDKICRRNLVGRAKGVHMNSQSLINAFGCLSSFTSSVFLVFFDHLVHVSWWLSNISPVVWPGAHILVTLRSCCRAMIDDREDESNGILILEMSENHKIFFCDEKESN